MKVSRAACLIMLLVVFLTGQACKTESVEPNAPQSRFDELMHVIRTGNAYQRKWAIPSFGLADDPRVVPVLIGLMKDTDAGVRTYAAQQLARLADERSTESLAGALNDSSDNVRMYAARGLAKIGREEHVPALVAAVVSNLPKSGEYYGGASSLRAKLEAIGKLSSKAPPEIVALLRQISTDEQIGEELWWHYEAVAICLGRIGEDDACPELLRAKQTLETSHLDYQTWYAVRKALANINPEKTAFDSPVADILYSVRPYKMTAQARHRTWIQPLVQLGGRAVEGLDWALRFQGDRDRERKIVAIEALGEIGGPGAAGLLRQYIQRVSDKPTKARRIPKQDRYALREAILALLKAEPTEETVEQVVASFSELDDFEQEYLLHDVSGAEPHTIPAAVRLSLYKKVLLGPEYAKSFGKYAPGAAAKLLGRMGGEQAGKILSEALLGTVNSTQYRSQQRLAVQAVARALGNIESYDAIPTLVEASKMTNAPAGAIAEAMGRRKDRRALTALQDMTDREKLTETDRLWIAAALARLGKDYERNAAVVRKALPTSLEPAEWLHDTQTIRAVAAFITDEGYTRERAISTLEAVGTQEAFEALTKLIDVSQIITPRRLQELSAAAARMAEKLGHESENDYAEIATVSETVPGWFEMHQRAQPPPEARDAYETVKRHMALARRLWIVEATRRLDLAAKPDAEKWQSHIPEQAIRAVSGIFGPELLPTLKRIAGESRDKVSFHGKYRMVDFYNVRSLTAKILTEKTGQKHTFVDADGRTHPGGWDPSQQR